MTFFISAFNTILYKPLFNALILFYKYLPGHDFGLAIILLTVLIKLLLYPLGNWSIKSQKSLSEIQPKMKDLQEKYKNDKEKQTRAVMELYKKEKINPFSGCLPILIQFPILIALYRVFWQGLKPEQLSVFLYSFMPHIESIRASFLGVIDLSRSASVEIEGVRHYLWPNLILIILVGVAQFFQTKMLTPKIKSEKNKNSNISSAMQKQMQYFMPIFMILILFKIPAAVALYWLTSTLFSIIQQYFIFRKTKTS